MSHFPVIVIGDDPATVLAPFDERLETEERLEPLDDTDCEVYRKMLAEKTGDHRATIRVEDIPRLLIEHYGADDRLESDGPTLYRRTTANPRAKWDWWVVGGRYAGWFHVRPEWRNTDAVAYSATSAPAIGEIPEARLDRCDCAQAKAIDWDAMITEGANDGIEAADTVAAALAGRTMPAPPSLDRDDLAGSRARFQAWWKEPTVHAAAEALGGAMIPPDHVYWLATAPRQDVAARCAAQRVAPYALATPEGWSAPGEMGMFGTSSDTDADRAAWDKRIADLLSKRLDGEAWLTLVDCHT